MTQSHAQEFDQLLEFLNTSRGFNFTGYKRTSLQRRIARRLQALQIEHYNDYQNYLEVHPDEFQHLFNAILINVTGFLRDAETWDFLNNRVLPQIINGREAQSPIRVWSAGTASGEEAYSIAMLLAERMGVEAVTQRVKIFATDLDDEALNKARQGMYTSKEVEDLPRPLLERYFQPVSVNFSFSKELRRSIIFGQHNLIQDAPISHLDLIACRNTLMYFNAETQARVLERFHFALNPSGYLFLGKAEMLLSHGDLFRPVDLHHRVFTKVPRPIDPNRMVGNEPQATAAAGHPEDSLYDLQGVAFESSPIAQMIINREGILALANARARTMFSLDPRDVGRPIQDLRLSYQPVNLRSAIEQVQTSGQPLMIGEVAWNHQEDRTCFYNILVTGLVDAGQQALGTSITFQDVTAYRRLQNQLERANQELETAMEELESTNEELETTNEELETTNEELQSTNEELETTNEELQSTNEELETINDEVMHQTARVNEANAYLNSILSSVQGSVIVINRSFEVTIWNTISESIWGVHLDEAMRANLASMDIGLPVEQLKRPIQSILKGETNRFETMLDATNRRGRHIRLRVTATPLIDHQLEVSGVVIIAEPAENQNLMKGEPPAYGQQD